MALPYNRRAAERKPFRNGPLMEVQAARSLHLALIRDISRTGLALETPGPLRPLERVRFQVRLPSGRVAGTATVRWVRPEEAGFRCGLEFQRLGWVHALRVFLHLNPEGSLWGVLWRDVPLSLLQGARAWFARIAPV